MEYDSDRFISKVNRNLICTICQCVLRDPVEDQNEHLFCRKCISNWLKNNQTCPIDRAKLLVFDLKQPSRVIKDLLSELEITCDYKNNGCSAIVTLDALESHLKSCEHDPKKPIPCPNGCDKQILKSKIHEHNCIRDLKNECKNLRNLIEESNRRHDREMMELKQLIFNMSKNNDKQAATNNQLSNLSTFSLSNFTVFKPHKEFETNGNVLTELQYQSITAMGESSNKSFEELRYQHYCATKRQNSFKK